MTLAAVLFGFLVSIPQTGRITVADREMTCSLRDGEGYLWYGGRGTGLCRFDGYETETFRSDRQNPYLLRSNDVLCMTEQRDNGEIWFGTKEGAYILRKKDYQVRPVVVKTPQDSSELADKRVSCMLAAADGTMWLSFRNQLLHFSGAAELLERFETTWKGKNRSITSIRFDADSALWAELWNGGLIRWKKAGDGWQTEKIERSEYQGQRHGAMTEEETGRMLDSVMSRQTLGKDTTVLSWARVPPAAFYIGTYHSLYFYDGERVELLQGELDKVRSMAYSEPSQSLYLLSKSRGVCRWKGERLTVLLDSTRFRKLRLQGDTALLLSEGVGGVSMLNLRTQTLAADTTTADVRPVVTACVTDGERQLIPFGRRELALPKGTDFVEICLSTLDYEHASQVQFAYRVDEDGVWTELPEGEHVVKMTHLPAGASRIQVRATDDLGRWSAPAEVLTIVRPARWYEHVWLWVICAALCLGAGCYLVMRIRRGRNSELSENPDKSALPVADQEFLDKAVAAVADHMTDSDYSVDALAGDLCMSRANLHRRMRSVINQTPTDFIRNQRLERAAKLLRTTSYSVNEIADLVGFSYASYFTKCFKEKYGVLPKDFQ